MKKLLLLPVLLISFSAWAQKNIQLLGHLPYGGNVECSNLTGYADTAGNEYALVGNTQGLSIVDITDPSNPTQLFLVPGATGINGLWREVREYKGYAYVTTEQQSGLVVVNLNYLPDSIQYHTINPHGMTTSHTIFIDENGIAYVNGTDKGQLFLDLDSNLWNPPYIGSFTTNYVHDCFVRNDTLWAACINDGFVKVIDVSDKTDANNPAKTLAQWNTPLNFSHNCWLSDDNRYLFTTDEKPNSTLTCYDVNDFNNITETNRTQVDPGSNTIIHNTYFKNNYCITSYYTYGITIHDVTRKNNLIEVGNFDSSPNFSGDGFNGAWGVWPYLPSGNIIISDIETGLWIVKPTYKRACYLEGVVKDSICNTLLNNVKIEIVEDTTQDFTNVLGQYSFGTPDSGLYTIRFTKNGYQTKEIDSVHLLNGILTNLSVDLVPIATSSIVIKTVDSITGADLPFVRVLILDSAGNTFQEVATNTNAQYTYCDFVQGKYDFYAGRWGKKTAHVNKTIATSVDTVVIPVASGYYDDFIMDYGWTIVTTASKGSWQRGKPEGTDFQGTQSNADADVAGDYGLSAYVTGNGGGQAGDDDVDNGYTILRSPLFNLSQYNDPHISFYRWFFNDGGSGNPNDTFQVTLSNGFDTMVVYKVDAGDADQSQWKHVDLRVKDFMFPAINMRIEFKVEDSSPGHLVEGGVDLFVVVDSLSTEDTTGIAEKGLQNVLFKAYPNPFTSEVMVDLANLHTSCDLEMINSLGQKVFSTRINQTAAVLRFGGELAEGIYFLRLKAADGSSQTVRLLKTR